MASLSYKPDGDTIKQFMKDESFFRGLRGPVGSGVSSIGQYLILITLKKVN